MGMACVGVQDIDIQRFDGFREPPGGEQVDFSAKRAGYAREVLDAVVPLRELPVRMTPDRHEMAALSQSLDEVACLLLAPAPAALFVKMQCAYHESPMRGSMLRLCAAQTPLR